LAPIAFGQKNIEVYEIKHKSFHKKLKVHFVLGNKRLFQMEESEPKVEPEEKPTGNEFDRSGVKN
jgi:hypothetical protein